MIQLRSRGLRVSTGGGGNQQPRCVVLRMLPIELACRFAAEDVDLPQCCRFK